MVEAHSPAVLALRSLRADDLKTTTSIAQSESFHADRLWLNGVEEDIKNPRLQACLR